MAKVRQIAFLSLLSVALLAGNVAAGPGGNRNGDPDGPQIAHPSIVEVADGESVVRPSVSPYEVVSERLSSSWRVVLRLYLRIHGIALG